MDLLNTKQYVKLRTEAIKNDNLTIGPTDYDINGTWDQSQNTNWQKELIGGTAKYEDLHTSFSGGNISTQFIIGAAYHKETSVLPSDFSDEKGSISFSINHISENKKLKLQLTGKLFARHKSITQLGPHHRCPKSSPTLRKCIPLMEKSIGNQPQQVLAPMPS